MMLEIIAWLATASITIWGLYLRSYMKEKAQNLAKKEDLNKLTSIVENIKSSHQKELAKLKSRLDHINLIHRVQFETEFKGCQTLYEAAYKAFVMLVRFKPTDESGFAPSSFENFNEAQLMFTSLLTNSSPFISLAVVNSFNAFEELLTNEKIKAIEERRATERGVFMAPESSETKRANREAITAALQRCGEAIRQHMSTMRVG